MAKKKKKWIQKADIKEGALKNMAKQAGFSSWREFCSQPEGKLTPLAKKRCALAKTLTRMVKK